MKFLNNYSKFFESSQSKKIRQYIGYSVVLKWYNENKDKIAKLLDVSPSELADEDTLMKQSYDLVNSVINPQRGGNTGISGTDVPGFEEFEKIENNLIHDILHNLFNVKYKEFNKSLSDIEFTESEIIEEIECLAIEESFMKYMNISYPKTDFINANINQLASYLIMAILKNDPERIQKILDDEVEPYLEVYGKKYPVKGTGFEDLFNLFKNKDADRSFRINNSEDFKNYMIKLINVGLGITETNGDRAQYPDGEYWGQMGWYSAPDINKINWIKSNFVDIGRNDISKYVTEYILLDNRDYLIKNWNFDYVLVGSGKNVFSKQPLNNEESKKIYNNIIATLIKLGFDENSIKNTKSAQLQVFLNDINYDTNQIKIEYLNKETNKKYRGFINIENIPNYLQPQLKLESLDFHDEKFNNREELEALPIKPRFIDIEKGRVKDFDGWFNYLNSLFDENIVYEIDDSKFIGIKKWEEEIENENEDYETVNKYSIFTSEEFEDLMQEDWNNHSEEYYPDDYKFINFDKYKIMSFDEVVKKLFLDGDSISIMRRNFRLGDTIKNNLSIGNLTGYGVDTEVIHTKNPAHKYLDFKGSGDPEKSLSKEILTSNGKKLVEILNNFRGYVINNFQKIKAEFKRNKAKFTEKDIQTFKKLNINTLKKVENFEIENLIINFTIWLNSKRVDFYLSSSLEEIGNFFLIFDDAKKLADLIENIDDIEYLKNFVNLEGYIKTTKDYYDFKKIIKSISNKNIFKYKGLIQKLQSLYESKIRISDDISKEIKDIYEKESVRGSVNVNLPEVKEVIIKFINSYLPNIKWSDLNIKEFDSIDIEFNVKVTT